MLAGAACGVAPAGHAFANAEAPLGPVAALALEAHALGKRLVQEKRRPFLLLNVELRQVLRPWDDLLDHVWVVRGVTLLTDSADVGLAGSPVAQSCHLACAPVHCRSQGLAISS